MKKVLLSLFALAFGTTVATADIPDPNFSSVEPADALNGAYLCPDIPAPIPLSENVITVKNQANLPIAAATVTVEFTAANNECPAAVLEGTTDSNGEVAITLAGGGCAHLSPSACVVKANGVGFRFYEHSKSSDYDGASGDGSVGITDLIKISNEFLDTDPNECHDYNNDGNVGIQDLVPFSQAFLSVNHCP
jgi:hypothetical protein